MNRTLIALLSLTVACGGNDEPDEFPGGDASDCTLSGTYTDDLDLSPDTCPDGYVLSGGVFIGDPDAADNSSTISIAPGTVIYGDNASKGFLAVQRGAKIDAVGTVDAPILFTSPVAVGARGRSDWGGIILNGKAPINACSNGDLEPGCTSEAEGEAGVYGGDDANDDSGVMKYVRIEWGGIEITPENEVNGLALQGVGSGTELSYIQVHMNKDDGVEFFGGTASIDHLVITGAGDDSLDWTEGWTGSASHVCIQQFADIGDRGFESDNFEDANDALPRSAPDLTNVTIIGAGTERIGMTLRRGTAGTYDKFVVDGFDTACLDVDDAATYDQLDGGALTMTNSLLACDTAFADDSGDGEDDDLDLEDWFLDGAGNEVANASGLDGWVSGGASAGLGCVPDGDDWTAGWTNADSK